MSNVEILKQGYQDFANGNVEAVLAIYDPDIVWEESSGFPYIEGDGVYHGPGEVAEKVFAMIPQFYDDFSIEIDQIFGSGDKVVMTGHYVGVWKETGKRFRANAAHVWTVKDDKCVHMFQVADAAEIINP